MPRILNKPGFPNPAPSSVSPSSFIFIALLIMLLAGALVLRNGPGDDDYKVLPLSTRAGDTGDSNAIANANDNNVPSRSAESLQNLAVSIRTRINETEGVYSVRFEDFSTNESFGINDEMVMTAASVIKIPILAGLYSLVRDGAVDLSETITIPAKDIQDWGTGTIRYQQPPVTYTFHELARLLIEKSDNTAAYVLTYRVLEEDRLQGLVESWGLTGTNVKTNDTTNKDMNKLFNLMLSGDIAGDLTDEMIGWTDDSDFEDRLPFLLPDDVTVYHKIGNEIRVINDVGVISYDGKPQYYLGVLSAEIPDEAEAKQVIAEISKMVYEYHHVTRQ